MIYLDEHFICNERNRDKSVEDGQRFQGYLDPENSLFKSH